MEFWQAIVMGLVQGLTEFLPVSSSAHLVFADHFLHMHLSEADTVSFDVLLHLGTLVAVLLYFRKDILALLRGAGQLLARPRLAWRENTYSRLFVLLILGTVPAAIAGVTLQDFFQRAFQNVPGTALLLFVTAGMLIWITRRRSGNRTMEGANWKDALTIGAFQALAILPGISRSGATITGGLLRGLDRDAAPRFSFLLSVPIILAGGLFDLKDTLATGFTLPVPQLAAGFVMAAVSGYLAVVLLLGIVRKGRLDRFAYYCVAVGVFMLAYWTLLVPKIDLGSAVMVASPTEIYHFNAKEDLFGPIELSKNISVELTVKPGMVPIDSVSAIMPSDEHSPYAGHTPAPSFVWKAGENRFYIENYKLLPLGEHYQLDAAGEVREIRVILRNRWGIQNEVRLRVRVAPEAQRQLLA